MLETALAVAQRSHRTALQLVSDLAEAMANALGGSLVDADLRLIERAPPRPADHALEDLACDPFALGRLYERLMEPEMRRRRGAHLTPEAVAHGLLGCLPGGFDLRSAETVFDPAVGGAAFLLAAAERLRAEGVPAQDVVARLAGFDIDEAAVAVAEAAVALWSVGQGTEPCPMPRLRLADGLLDDWPSCDLVVGNPPFLNQLRKGTSADALRRRSLRERWGDLRGAYTDAAWLFLAGALDAVEPGGAVALLQPVSVLAARHAQAVRAHVEQYGRLTGLWIADRTVFDASVNVCGVTVLRDLEQDGSIAVERWTGSDFERTDPFVGRPDARSWGPIAAPTRAVPHVAVRSAGTLGELASSTAGFRDQFYGFAPHVFECATPERDPGVANRLVTVGMIDPFVLRWGAATFRFAKRTLLRPVVDVDRLEADDPKLARWLTARRRPKVLVATQTRVIEAWVDERGDVVPATPVISVEPVDAGEIWLVAAVIAAAPLSAHLLASKFGTALNLDAIKVAAADLTELPLPADRAAWARGAELAQQLNTLRLAGAGTSHGELMRSFGEAMAEAYGVGGETVEWWLSRLPDRPGER